MTRTATLLLGIGLAATFVACKPKAGAACKIELKEVCTDEKHALACHDGKWEEMQCRGPAGCAKSGSENTCDQSIAEDKDVCNVLDDHLCTSDKKSMLECNRSKRWSFVQSCLGPRACVLDQKKVTCDNSVANAGDTCTETDDYACTLDGLSALVCKDGKFTIASICKGKNHCKVAGDKSTGFKVECDDQIANVGDPCEREGHYSCTPDEKSIVKCKDKKFVQDDKCKRNEKCAVRGELVGCY